MKCPECCSSSRVITTNRLDDGIVVRRRGCNSCDYRWYTKQLPEECISKYNLKWIPNGKVCGIKATP